MARLPIVAGVGREGLSLLPKMKETDVDAVVQRSKVDCEKT